jgi:hypothetical protein
MIEIVGSPDPGDRAVRVLAQLGSGDVVRLDPTTGGLELVAMRTDLLPPPGVFASELLMPWNSATFLDSRALGHAYVFRRTDEAICDVVEPIYPWSVLLDEDRDGTIDRLLVLRNGDDVDARGIQGPPPDGPR